MAASAASSHFLLHLRCRPRAVVAAAGTASCAPAALPRARLRCAALGTDLLGDFGARDPFPAEIESNFGEKVIGFSDTEHRILVPVVTALSLAELSCEPIPSSQTPMPRSDAEKLLKKIVGWRLVEDEGVLKIQGVWKLRDPSCREELISRIRAVVEPQGHLPVLRLDEPNIVIAELWTASIGGLSMNDFIVAAKIDQIETKDLLPRKRAWA